LSSSEFLLESLGARGSGQRFSWIPSPGHDLGGCRLQARSSIVVVGAPFLWSKEDAAGVKAVRFRGVHGIMNRSG
jgi:hypothetical protein